MCERARGRWSFVEDVSSLGAFSKIDDSKCIDVVIIKKKLNEKIKKKGLSWKISSTKFYRHSLKNSERRRALRTEIRCVGVYKIIIKKKWKKKKHVNQTRRVRFEFVRIIYREAGIIYGTRNTRALSRALDRPPNFCTFFHCDRIPPILFFYVNDSVGRLSATITLRDYTMAVQKIC